MDMTKRIFDADIQPHCSIVLLTGAGISQESGLDTFRDAGGVWQRYNLDDVATPDGFTRNPELVHEFYNHRRHELENPDVKPNPAHRSIARLQKHWPGSCFLVTQNIDNLHERAGSPQVHHMHGSLADVWCRSCDHRFPWDKDTSQGSICPICNTQGHLRPDIVWFGEQPYGMQKIQHHLETCDVYVIIGTSAEVYPAAMFWQLIPQHCIGIEINIAPTSISDHIAYTITGPAGKEVPRLVDRFLNCLSSVSITESHNA